MRALSKFCLLSRYARTFTYSLFLDSSGSRLVIPLNLSIFFCSSSKVTLSSRNFSQ
ncbi:unnamed protein product [Meloidogyne enterolobii]|uniref:Uncharacterized protein n=1 Tax=Meloidogyne enterolobii TaxID=390850 RepID=A0ACB0ZPY2_MELEN